MVLSPMAVRRNERPKNALPWRQRRVGCKRSTPNPMISPPFKKSKKELSGETIQEDSHGDTFNIFSDEFPFSHKELLDTAGIQEDSLSHEELLAAAGIQENFLSQELRINQEDIIPDLEDERTTADPDLSGARNWSMSVHCGTTAAHLSAEAGNSYFTDSKINKEERAIADPETRLSAEGGSLYFTDSKEQKGIPEEEPKIGATPIDKELASDAESRVDPEWKADRWTCRVCKDAVVSIAVLPCSHLCLCWDCEFDIDDCPVCGEPKTGCFYIRSP